ncbi:MAG: amino acid permease [Clostridia bacterium]|nr:amino acid permease [Clostridia bacterium]
MNKSNSAKDQSLSFIQGLAIVVGMIIGSGIFLKPSIVLRDAGSTTMALAAWVIGGIVTLASALSIAEIASNIPLAGGLYTYLEKLYSDKLGFLLGWVQSVISYPASVAAQAIAFATYSAYFIPMTTWQQRMLGIGVLALLLVLNIISTRCGGIIQVAATVGKLVPVIAILGIGLVSGQAPGASGLSAELIGGTSPSLSAAILGTLWAYDGWIGVTNMAGEMRSPKKNLPRVISIGIIFVIVVYALFNIVLFNTLPAEHIASTGTPGSDAAVALFGESGAAFLTAGIMVSVFGALNGYLMTAARVPQSMAERGQLPMSGLLGRLHPRFGTPANALIMQSILAVVYILSGSFNALTDLLIFVLWIFFTLGVIGVFILRKKGMSSSDNYRVPLYPITPVVGILGSIFILGSTMIDAPVRSLIGLGVTLLGLPVYSWLNKKK